MNQKQIELTDVLLSLFEKHSSTGGFSVIGVGFPENENHYNQMASFDDISQKPSWSEVVAEYDVLVSVSKAEEYKYQRAAEYPSLEEQLDAIFHGGLDAWKQQIQAIKDKYPKV